MVGQAVLRAGIAQDQDLLTVNRADLDLQNSHEVSIFLKKHKPTNVILAAAKVGGIYANSSNKRKFLTENLQIQNSVISGALEAGIEKLIFLGSSCVYPKLATQPMQEESLLTGPLETTNEGYALAKISGVKLCQYIREETGLDYFSLMPTNLYGPGDNFNAENSHVPAALIRKFYEAKTTNASSVKIWGSGNAMREFMHVYDLADAIWFALEKPPAENLINVGLGSEISIGDFARKIAKIASYHGDIEFDTSMPEGTPRKLLDSTKFFEMGWRPKISLDIGLESTYKWFIENIESGAVRGYDK